MSSMVKKLTQDEVIERFVAKHGDRYDYSLVEYVDSKTKVKIICPVHGVFDQIIANHLKGKGCPRCAGRVKRTNADFELDSRAIHGDKYEYSKVIYVDTKTEVTITCKLHGDFIQTPHSHLSGRGCGVCRYENVGKKLRKTTSEIVASFIKVHGNRYDYSLVKHVNSNHKVKIVCKEHGVFEQLPHNHIIGQGCPECNKPKVFDISSFVSQANLVHNSRYDYSKSEYCNYAKKLIITCNTHGDFSQAPSEHLGGQGCPECGKIRVSESRKKKFSVFVSEANLVHDHKYAYIEDTYTFATQPMTIVCFKHGEFAQTPSYHLSGAGCQICGGSLPLNIDVVKDRAKAIYGDLYDYSDSEYINYHTRIKIKCKEHGFFWKTPAKHIGSDPQGCPKCSEYGFDSKKPSVFYIYLIDKFVGFGITNNISRRDADHRANLKVRGYTVEGLVTYGMSGDDAKQLEKVVKLNFKGRILNTGVPGFMLEAVGLDNKSELFSLVKENLPEGRFVKL